MRKYGLSGNTLKWIAAIFMVIDHVGVILFPQMLILRILGRLSFPIFAFMIAEGCRYTRNKCRYFLMLFGVGSVCQIVLFLYNRSMEMNILLTFSLSVLLVFSFADFKEQLCNARAACPLYFCPFGAFGGADRCCYIGKIRGSGLWCGGMHGAFVCGAAASAQRTPRYVFAPHRPSVLARADDGDRTCADVFRI